MTLVASLGMYDHPAQRTANDRLWRTIADGLRRRGMAAVPDTLDRDRPIQSIWRDPALLFGQACGYPLASDPTLSLRILAFPVYDAPFCTADTHRSVIVVRRDEPASRLCDYRGRRAAINGRDSNSGMNLFRAAVARVADGTSFFASVAETGSHRASAQAIAADEVDIAAIDAVTYAALERFEPAITARLRILASTVTSPTLPFVTAASTDADAVLTLREALAEAMADPALEETRATLFLTDAVVPSNDRLKPLLGLERDAARASYPDLR